MRRTMERLGIASDSEVLQLKHVDALLTHILRRHEQSVYDRDDPRSDQRDPKLEKMYFQVRGAWWGVSVSCTLKSGEKIITMEIHILSECCNNFLFHSPVYIQYPIFLYPWQ